MGAVCCRAAVCRFLIANSYTTIDQSVTQPVDFDGDVNLFHFSLLRCVGKGAFGKVRCLA
jgi:hypothetical protein